MTWSSELGAVFPFVFLAGMIALKVAAWMSAEKESWSEFLDLALQCTVVLQGIMVGGLFFLWLVGVLRLAHIVMVLVSLGFVIVIFELQPEGRKHPK